MGRVLCVVVDGLFGHDELVTRPQRLADILIAGKPGKVAAGDFQADPMSRLENVAGLPEADVVLVDLARFDQRRSFQGIPEARSPDPLADVNRLAVGTEVAQRGRPVGVHGAGGGVELEVDGAGDFHVLLQRFRGVDQDILPDLNRASVFPTANFLVSRDLSSQSRDRVLRIVGVAVRGLVLGR